MANIFLFTTIVIVVSSSVNSERRSFLRYSNILQKAVPHIWKHDQEELNRNMVKNSGQPQVRAGPRLPPLRPVPSAPWPLRIHQNQLTDKELTQKRVHQLQNKLTPNIIIPVRKINQPHPKPEIEVRSRESKRHKRDTTQSDNDTRQKRQVIINPQLQLEVVMQPHIQPAPMQENEAQYQEKITEKRDKRQILLMIKQQRPLAFAKKPRTTPNPFIRETNIADYDIVRPDTYKPEVEVINTADTDSYQLNEEASEFSNILSNFYLATSAENWLEIQQFAEKVLKPLPELLGAGVKAKYLDHGTNRCDTMKMAPEEMVNRRVKRKLDKTLIRKRRKKRKQKQRRVEGKRLRMRTHARRLRKQHKSKLARLERHYARMNLTTTAIPEHLRDNNRSAGEDKGTARQVEKGVVKISKGKSVEILDSESEIDSSEYDTASESEDNDSDSEYDSSDEEEDKEPDLVIDDGNDEYDEDYDDDSSSNSHEYVDYENVVDEPDKSKEKNKKESDKKQTNKKETSKIIIKKGGNKKGKKS